MSAEEKQDITPNSQPILYLLQAWRALAAFIVAYGHTTNEALTISKQMDRAYNYVPYPNAVGVDIFFVISGFVILYTAQKSMGRSGQFGPFMIKRLIRIAPVYWFYTFLLLAALLIFPTALNTVQYDFWHMVKSLFFIPHERPIGDAVRPFLSLGWSLNYEMYFYIIFGVLLFLPLDKLVGVLSCFLISTVLIGLYLPEDWVMLNFWFDPYVLEFLSGVLIAYAFIKGVRLPAWSYYALTGIGFSILIALFFPDQRSLESQFMRFIVGSFFVAAACLPQGVLDKKVPHIFTALGNSSYSLYLSHPFVIGAMKVIWTKLWFITGALSLWIYVAVTLVGCLIGGHVSYLLIEKPSLKSLRKIFVPERAGAKSDLP